ncbi:hypothetical protein LB579_33940, partial [Mesorhizobium sp. BR1-1-7]|uniref:hypothetical protein n=1 Tax=Mesorhizobium sp. BR1-1-7 TaxID=2876647 RepID=UPI001CCA5F0D
REMGNFVGLTSSAGVVQKVLPKHHNRTRRPRCGLYATQLGHRRLGNSPATKKAGQCPAFHSILQRFRT